MGDDNYTSIMHKFSRRVLFTAAAIAAAQTKAIEPVRLPRRIRLGLLGFDGHVGDIISPLPQLPDVEVVAISDANPDNLRRRAANPRLSLAKQYTDYNQMLDAGKLDVVAVNNNNGERAAAVLACARRGLHVISEKPLAIHRKDLDQIRRTVTEKKVSLGLILPMRYEPVYKALKRIVDEGAIGEVAQMGAQKSYIAGDRAEWFLNRATYGGTIPWIGIHMIDLMRWTSGREFREAASFQSHIGFPELREMENVTASMFQLDNGGVATLRMDFLRSPKAASHGDDRLRIAGTKGVVEYMEATGVTLMTTEKKPHRVESLPERGSVFIDYLQATFNGKPPTLSVADIFRVNEITLAAHEAALQKKILAT